jgi:general secretion pathway protein H
MTAAFRTRREASTGFSLIEVLIVVALMALMTAAIVAGSGMLGSTRLRSGATLVLTGIRLGITRANATGLPVRLVFDITERRLSLEETQGKMLRVTGEGEEAPGAGAEGATEEEKAAEAEAKGILEGPRAPKAQFSPVKELGFEDENGQAGRELGRGISFVKVQTEHDAAPRTEGRAYLYFWPGGGTEKAIVQLAREGDDEPLTVLISRLTGRAKIERGAIELDEPRSGADFGEREEP